MSVHIVPDRLVLAVLVPAVLVVVAAPAITPAYAHAGGRAQLYVASVNLAPQGQGWALRAVLRDLDSGAPQPGFAVQTKGSGPGGASFGPMTLADPDNDGSYEAVLAVVPGEWALTLEANEIPGGNAALPFSRTWNVVLTPGQGLDIAGSGSSPGGKGGGADLVLRFLVVLAAAMLLGVIGTRLVRRRAAMVT